MKRCSYCGEMKAVSEFNAKCSRCKPCNKTYNKIWEAANREKVQAYKDRWERDNPEKRAESIRQYYLRNQRAHIETMREYRRLNPDKSTAHRILGRAVRAGKLKRGPCEKCGSTKNVQGHHRDYSKPLEVQWLCCSCHKKEHRAA